LILGVYLAKVAVVKGESRKANILKALKMMENDIDKGIAAKGSDTLFIKVNGIDSKYPVACTHPDALEAVLEFFYDKFGKVIVGDNTYVFSRKGENIYAAMKSKFKKIKFSDLTEYKTKNIHFRGIHNGKVGAKASLLPQKAYTISLALPKTHDAFIYTGCAKNMFGCVISNRPSMHGLRIYDRLFLNLVVRSNSIKNENMLEVLSNVKADLSILDGFVAMEGNGPLEGTEVGFGIAACGTDEIAIDSLVSNMMGFDKIPYLEMCGERGIGVSDISKIKVVKRGFDDLDQVRIRARPHYLINYLTVTDGIKYWLPVVDIKLIFYILKRFYRIKDKLREYIQKRRQRL